MSDSRFDSGMATVAELFPDPSFVQKAVSKSPKEVKEDWDSMTISTVMGEIWSRPGLDKKYRAIATLSALTVLNRPSQLKVYIIAALNLGLSRQEISEAIMQMGIYGGFPSAIDGLKVAAEVFEEQ